MTDDREGNRRYLLNLVQYHDVLLIVMLLIHHPLQFLPYGIFVLILMQISHYQP
jgi:MFS-type transporter involved in bile tolerance (Atg22 family)